LNQYPPSRLTKVVSAKISVNDYGLLKTIANEYFTKYRVIKQPSITEIVRYLIKYCINANFPPKQAQIRGTTDSHANSYPSYEDFIRQL